MKSFILSFLLSLFIASSLFAEGQLFFPKAQLSAMNDETIQQYLINYFADLQKPSIQLQLSFHKKTKVSQHFTYAILVENIPLFQHEIKVNTNQTGTIISIKREGNSLTDLANFSIQNELFAWSKIDTNALFSHLHFNPNMPHQAAFNIQTDETFPNLILVYHQWSRSSDDTWLINKTGEIVKHFNHLLYANKDSLVSVQIFKPDPLTLVQQAYGGIYVDNGNANASWMNPAYSTENIMATYDDIDQKFYLENQYIKLDDFESPTILPSFNTIPQFHYTRDESGFEDANVFYHITNFHDYISSLGYDSLMNLQLIADAHGQFSADNSVFNRNGGNPTISFGVGGVDDGEDADVIIHEYCHGISWSANNNNTFDVERSGLDEGVADYFATSYSRSITSFDWTNLFNWDGHNQYWGGRIANTSNNYPSTGNIYAVGEIWNSAMSAIWTDLGQLVTDKLMLETLHFFTPQTTLPEAALYVMQADTLLFGGVNANVICQRFRNKNIFNDNCRPLTNLNIQHNNEFISLQNSLGFSSGDHELIVQCAKPCNMRINLYTMQGKLLLKEEITNQDAWRLNPRAIQSGMYVLQIQIDSTLFTEKIVKW